MVSEMVLFSAAAAGSDRPATVICDDLSGACEIAGLLHQEGRRAVVVLGEPCTEGATNVVDLGVRAIGDHGARDAVAAALASWDVSYVKVDSLLRGPIAAIVAGCQGDGRRVLVCPALPSAGRTIVDGAPFLDGWPLSASDAWDLERTRPPSDLAELLAPLSTERISLHASDVGSAGSPRDTVLCADAATDADLDRLAALARQHDLLPVGSAGLFAALLRQCDAGVCGAGAADVPGGDHDVGPKRSHGVVVAVGTASARADEQIAELRRAGAYAVKLDPSEAPQTDTAIDVVADGGTVLLHWNRDRKVDPQRAVDMTKRLTDMVARIVAANSSTGLVLTGGHTARSVLERLGETTLRPASVVHHGALVATTSSGRRVAVRPGSFGDAMSLVQLRNEVEFEERAR